jgi:hypothetical protein
MPFIPKKVIRVCVIFCSFYFTSIITTFSINSAFVIFYSLHLCWNFRTIYRGLETELEKGYRTGPPGYIGWRNLFLIIDSWAS